MRNAIFMLAAVLILGACSAKSRNESPDRDLAQHLISQLSSRTEGNSPDFTGPTDGSNFFQSRPTNTPNFWLRDVTNILAMSQCRVDGLRLGSSANYLTPVSPHICLAAAHTGGGLGTLNLWLLPDGSYFENTVTNNLIVTNAPDVVLMFMAKTNWTFVRIFPNATSKLKNWQKADSGNPVPVFVRFHQGIGRTNRFHSTFVSASRGPGSFGHEKGQLEYGDYSKGDTWVAGDSSGAAYAIVQNEAALVCVASSGGGGTALGMYTNQINAAMAVLCASNGLPAERLSLYDLGWFQDYTNR